MKCKCGTEIEETEFTGFFAEGALRCPECQKAEKAANDAEIARYEAETPEEHKHRPLSIIKEDIMKKGTKRFRNIITGAVIRAYQTTEHAASSYGHPVWVNADTGKAFDLLGMEEVKSQHSIDTCRCPICTSKREGGKTRVNYSLSKNTVEETKKQAQEQGVTQSALVEQAVYSYAVIREMEQASKNLKQHNDPEKYEAEIAEIVAKHGAKKEVIKELPNGIKLYRITDKRGHIVAEYHGV